METDAVLPTSPIIFTKPPSCIINDGDDIIIPKGVTNVQHEVELALIVGKKCKDVSKSHAMDFVSHVAVFNDITARDMQIAARNGGNPWSLAKGMDTFGPISDYMPIGNIDIDDLTLTLEVNGRRKQTGHTGDMIFSPAFLVEFISRFITLEPGDIIATGTPEGVSQIVPGDIVVAAIEGVGRITNKVT
jgi:2-keto-4-pentenoate hydratase/2-oxohepta-3-ene-1,7-dioic acid hydratase in catechol pathway